jgi:CRP/FNR family cyclic AMP-dependent transcriptional regulator
VESWWPALRLGDLVGTLTDDEHARLLGAMEPCTAESQDLIFQKGSPSRSLLLVEEGQIEVFDEVMGQAVVLASVGPGGIVGEVGFVDGRPRTHHVRAQGACRLRRLTREGLLDLVKGDPVLFAKLTIALAQLLAQRFRSAMDELEPVRAFAASLREPLEPEEGLEFEQIDEPLPEAEPAEPDAAAAVKLIKDVARRARKKRGPAAV